MILLFILVSTAIAIISFELYKNYQTFSKTKREDIDNTFDYALLDDNLSFIDNEYGIRDL